MSSPVRLQRPRNLSLETSKSKSRVTFKEDSAAPEGLPSANNTPSSPRKFRYEADFRAKRKRAHSCSFSWDHFNTKRRKPAGAIVLPSKFLLGGNITDPLNLEALDKGDSNKTGESPNGGRCRRSGTVRVIIPPNINDPLNLDACSEDGEEQLADAISRQRRRRKSKKRKRRNSEPGGIGFDCESDKSLCPATIEGHASCEDLTLETPDTVLPSSAEKEAVTIPPPPAAAVPSPPVVSDAAALSRPPAAPVTLVRGASDPGVSLPQNEETSPVSSSAQSGPAVNSRHPPQKKPRSNPENKIVSPVVPQPGVERKRHASHQRHPSLDKTPTLSHSHLHPPKRIHPKNPLFQYGNYNQYYGYRNLGHKMDPRLKTFKKEWFVGKEVLDIGCNIGHITLSIARDFGPHQIVGVDIDKKLVKIARKNIKHYVANAPEAEDEFPSSMKLLYGPLGPPVNERGQRKFPHNVKFYQANYAMENDALLETVRPEFDTILCLSVTKWVHLNFGDDGLKRFFKRMFRNLKPGGVLVLEPQGWPSYANKRKLTNEIFENYKNIRLFPHKFGEFLTMEVGFTYVKKVSAYQHYSRGFDRPIYVYKKPLSSEKCTAKKGTCSCPGTSTGPSHTCRPSMEPPRSAPLRPSAKSVSTGNEGSGARSGSEGNETAGSTEGSETPKKTEGSDTPKKTEGSETPKKTVGSETANTMCSETPKKTVGSETPKKTVGSDTPKKTVGSETANTVDSGTTSPVFSETQKKTVGRPIETTNPVGSEITKKTVESGTIMPIKISEMNTEESDISKSREGSETNWEDCEPTKNSEGSSKTTKNTRGNETLKNPLGSEDLKQTEGRDDTKSKVPESDFLLSFSKGSKESELKISVPSLSNTSLTNVVKVDAGVESATVRVSKHTKEDLAKFPSQGLPSPGLPLPHHSPEVPRLPESSPSSGFMPSSGTTELEPVCEEPSEGKTKTTGAL